MTGTFQEDTQISATAATFDQDMTLVSGESGVVTQTVGKTVGYNSSIGSLTPNTIRHNGEEYTIKSFVEDRLYSTYPISISLDKTPSFSEITLSIDGTELTFSPVSSLGFKNNTATKYLLVKGETQTIKIISIE